MDFVSKNFTYETKTFGNFLESINKGEKLYLRSLAADQPADMPADIVNDFPDIASDFTLPDKLSIVRENKHSCPLRISGPVNMWLHYDVCSPIFSFQPYPHAAFYWLFCGWAVPRVLVLAFGEVVLAVSGHADNGRIMAPS